ncbi:hypothetical protein [Mesorhizobium sp. M0058]|uniref:hypothetical protein n=1 Tax=Mesorhizobium sp. M0058 TaxID=2956865 RepID=UPI00333D48ED
MFSHIVETLDAPEVWRFLATLIVAGWSEAGITDEIDAMLAELVDEREEISVKRKAFVAQLLGLGTGSACRFSQTPCFKRSISSCAADLGAAHTVDSSSNRDALQVARYDRTIGCAGRAGVDRSPTFGSGQGKTCRLCRAAQEMIDAGQCAMLLAARGELADIEAKEGVLVKVGNRAVSRCGGDECRTVHSWLSWAVLWITGGCTAESLT